MTRRITDNRLAKGSDFMHGATKKWNEGLHRIEDLGFKLTEMAELVFSNGLMGSMSYDLTNEVLTIPKFSIVVKGQVIDVMGANNLVGTDNLLKATRTTNTSNDSYFIFIEVWERLVQPGEQVHKGGGIHSGVERLADSLEKVVEWRLRLEKGVNFYENEKGLETSQVSTKSYNGLDVDLSYVAGSDRKDLFIVGDGSTETKAILGTFDGYMYAMPVLKLSRTGELSKEPEAVPEIVVDITEPILDGSDTIVVGDVEGLKPGFPIRIAYWVMIPDPVNLGEWLYEKRYIESEILSINELLKEIKLIQQIQIELALGEQIKPYEPPAPPIPGDPEDPVDPSNPVIPTIPGQMVPSGPQLETIPDIVDTVIPESLLEDKVVELERQMERVQDYTVKSKGKDNYGTFTTTEYLRTGGSLFLRSELLEKNSEGLYLKMKWSFFNYLNELVGSKSWILSYDSEGDCYAKEVTI